MKRLAGFSLIEMVILLAVLAIAGAIGFINLRALDTRSRVRQAAQVVVQEINLARAQARESNGQTKVEFGATGSDSFVYTDPSSGGHTVVLPSTAVFSAIGASALVFKGPFGTLTPPTAATTFVIRSTRDSSVTATVKVVGVLGKVYVQ